MRNTSAATISLNSLVRSGLATSRGRTRACLWHTSHLKLNAVRSTSRVPPPSLVIRARTWADRCRQVRVPSNALSFCFTGLPQCFSRFTLKLFDMRQLNALAREPSFFQAPPGPGWKDCSATQPTVEQTSKSCYTLQPSSWPSPLSTSMSSLSTGHTGKLRLDMRIQSVDLMHQLVLNCLVTEVISESRIPRSQDRFTTLHISCLSGFGRRARHVFSSPTASSCVMTPTIFAVL